MIVSTAFHDDLPRLLALEESGFEPSERWSEASWAAELARDDRLVLVARHGDELDAVACLSVLGGTAELLRVIVHPTRRGRQIARRLIGVGKEWAEAAGADRMLLEVRHDNAAALGLYTATGFDVIARRRDYYGPGRDGLVMQCQLAHVSLLELGRWRR